MAFKLSIPIICWVVKFWQYMHNISTYITIFNLTLGNFNKDSRLVISGTENSRENFLRFTFV